jgi:hypothetical protein
VTSTDLSHALNELRRRKISVPLPPRLPTEVEVQRAEHALGRSFPADYRRYLLEASDVVFSTLEPAVVIPDMGHLDLVEMARDAWAFGVPEGLLPFCEDNSDYFCLDDRRVVYWSHNGVAHESWPDLATWIMDVWIGEHE